MNRLLQIGLSGVLFGFLLSGCSPEPEFSTSSDVAIRHYREGVSLFEKFYYREALDAFEKSLEADSTFALAWGRIALTHSRSHATEPAREAMARAKKNVAGASRRERLYIQLWNALVEYSFKDAALVADSIVALYPAEKMAYHTRGLIHEIDKEYDEALEIYQAAMEMDTGYPLAVMSLGYLYSTIGEHEKAIKYMRQYIRLVPETADPRASYGDLLVRVGRYDEALEQYEKSLELKPDYWYAIQEIGKVHMILGRLRKAEEQFRASSALLPQTPTIEASMLTRLAHFEMHRGKYDDAVTLYRSALAIEPFYGSAAYGLTNALMKVRRFEEARQMISGIYAETKRRGLAESSAMLDYHVLRARFLAEQDSLDESLTQCEKALEYSGQLNRAYVFQEMARINLKQRAYESALFACDEALAMNPNSPFGLLLLTRVYHAQGEMKMTQEIGSRLLKLWGKADEDFRYLKELRRLLKGRPAV
ncbi:MAG: tetratricopeptide repeat protein [Bacteroidota bacterium]